MYRKNSCDGVEVLPYRSCVGVAVFNAVGKVWAGRRKKGKEIRTTWQWQMPQGGINKGENPFEAACRELREETGIHSTMLIAEGKKWLQYDFPPELIGRLWGGKYRGQRQKWFAMRFLGEQNEITINTSSSSLGITEEFEEWAWVDLQSLPQHVVGFKRSVYEQVAKWFTPFTTTTTLS